MISWTSEQRLKWDMRWLGLAEYVASFSKDPSTQTGAVIVRPDQTVASIGYNGFPRKMPDLAEHYFSREEKYSRIVHCEINARDVLNERPIGYTLYTWPFLSCDRCAVQMIQAGIARVVAPICPPDKVMRWGSILQKSRNYFEECQVECVELPFPGLSEWLNNR